jgi:hypothetical protein
MADLIDSKMPSELQVQAKKIIQQFGLENMKVHFDSKTKSLVFDMDRRVVTVPVELIEQEKWADIRFLFRAILESSNSLWNRAADDNDWGGSNFYGK